MSPLMNIHNSYPFLWMYVSWIYNSEGTIRKKLIGGFQNNLFNQVVSEVSASNE